MENACSFHFGVSLKIRWFSKTSPFSQGSKVRCFPNLPGKNYLRQLSQSWFPGLRWSPGICIFSKHLGDSYHCHKAKAQSSPWGHHITGINTAVMGKCTFTSIQLGSHWDSWLRISSSSQDVKHINECAVLIITHNGFLLHVLGECHMPWVPGSRKSKY